MSPLQTLAGRILDAIDRFLNPFTLDPEERSQRLATGFICLAAIPVLYFYGAVHLLYGNNVTGVVEIITAVSLTVSFFYGRVQRKIETLIKMNLGSASIFFFQVLLRSGTRGYAVYWLYPFPVAVFFLLGPSSECSTICIFLAGRR